jgi:hypothetical protein
MEVVVTAPFPPHDLVSALKQAEWSLGLSGSAITTLTDARFVGRIGRGLRSLHQDVVVGRLSEKRTVLIRHLADGGNLCVTPRQHDQRECRVMSP